MHLEPGWVPDLALGSGDELEAGLGKSLVTMIEFGSEGGLGTNWVFVMDQGRDSLTARKKGFCLDLGFVGD